MMSGFYTLFYKEILRFLAGGLPDRGGAGADGAVVFDDFSRALSRHVDVFPAWAIRRFDSGPGDDVDAAKRLRQYVFQPDSVKNHRQYRVLLLPPFVAPGFFTACAGGGGARAGGGRGVFAVTLWFDLPALSHPLWALAFAVLGCAVLATLGLIAGIWADKFDQLAAFQNFLIMPLTFCRACFIRFTPCRRSGAGCHHANPVFYMIDGFRYGFCQSDALPLLSLAVVSGVCWF